MSEYGKTYIPSKPCARGHKLRYMSTGHCIECAAINSAKYRAINPSKCKESIQRWLRNNPERRLEQRKRWEGANVERLRISKRLQSGLPIPTRECPLLCECCGNPPGKRALSLDHDHKTGAFRGWLCGKCNTAIGKLGDDINGLMLAVAYVLKNT